MIVKKATKLWILQAGGRFRIQLDQVSAGNLIAIEGIDETITKTATLVDVDAENPGSFSKLDFGCEPAIKVACEPLNPSDLPKMLEGLRKISKSYPMAKTKVEESGEHVVMGTGEL
jgi:U5 small nuclear ribonucleoprotein component